jgi:hypothetical protein
LGGHDGVQGALQGAGDRIGNLAPIHIRRSSMIFKNVSIAGLAHVDAPHTLTSDEINERLKPTMQRLGIKTDVLNDIVGVHARRLWDDETQASDAATMAAKKALADAGIDATGSACWSTPRSAATSWSRPPPASSAATSACPISARPSTSPMPAWPSSTAWTSPRG